MKPIIIIADDLTGACDTGIKFHNLGLRTKVLTGPVSIDSFAGMEDAVISINTGTRCVPGPEAGRIVKSVLASLGEKGDFYFYKKVDSVLRGNVMPEVEGVMDALRSDFAIVAPAFPETGRRVRNGVLHIQGPPEREDTVDALALLQGQTERKCALIDGSVVRQGPQTVAEYARKLFREGATVLLADAWSQADLNILAEAVLALGSRCVPVGSAGLAQSIALKMLTGNDALQVEEEAQAGLPLIVVGTRHPVTLRQLRHLKESAALKTYLIPAGDITRENLSDQLQRMLDSPLNPDGCDGILLTTDGIYYGTEPTGVSLLRNDHNPLILDALGRSVKALVEECMISGIVATGGDVALEVLNRLELPFIDLVAEPIPGIVAGRAKGNHRTILMATKSGGFGNASALLDMLQYIGAANQAACTH